MERKEILIAKLGSWAIGVLEELSSLVQMARETAAEVGDRLKAKRTPIRRAHFFTQTARVGVGSLPLICLVSVFIGLTLALLTGYQLDKFGMVTLVPPIVAISFVREMGPLFTGIVIAARIGAAYTAELGAMVAADEVEAIEAMGIGPLRYLVTPRFLAIFFLTPCLSVVSIIAGIGGGAFISNLLLSLGWDFFFNEVIRNLLVKDIVAGVIKSFLFGGIVGWIACYKGLGVTGGATGVGTATTSSVVTTISSVIACDSICNILIVIFFP
jgi:phospholipid/cholesterol/gamma-HCH transport system permease protein